MKNLYNTLSKQKPKLSFRYADRKLLYPQKQDLKENIITLFKKEKKALNSLTYIFCSDDFLLNINQQFLQHNYYTDIITFCLSEKNEPIEAEAYISIDRVKDNAKVNNVLFKEELERVVFHGALHLCGYKDKKKDEIKQMRDKENYYLKQRK
ncbi:MAG: rRNA maturation RNase YbeY [Chitinophagaceae bacterium]|nr:rRNA maturation RNase YbeY [Chitinophagaceae bacterium]MCW5904216.1 rRNA maturation RNase YbeY [Chitinophagaceae bacterium]